MTIAEWMKVSAYLANKGLIYDTRERRNGEILWGLTPKGLQAQTEETALTLPQKQFLAALHDGIEKPAPSAQSKE